MAKAIMMRASNKNYISILSNMCGFFLVSVNRNPTIVRPFRAALPKIALRSSINSTTMGWTGTMWHAITRNHGFARTM